MRCPNCHRTPPRLFRTLRTTYPDEVTARRWRRCQFCDYRFTTIERIEDSNRGYIPRAKPGSRRTRKAAAKARTRRTTPTSTPTLKRRK